MYFENPHEISVYNLVRTGTYIIIFVQESVAESVLPEENSCRITQNITTVIWSYI